MGGVRSFAVLVLGAFLVAVLAPAVQAVTSVSLESGISETIVIPAGTSHAYSIALSDVDTLRLDVRSTMGFLLDVYVVNSTNFLAYERGSTSFVWIPGPSAENVGILQADFRPAQDGVYYVIVDNGNASPTGAVPLGEVSASVSLGPALATVEPSWVAMGLIVGLGVVFAVVLVLTYVRPGWHERPWVRRSWTGPAPARSPAPTPPMNYNEFRDTPPKA